MEQLPVAHQPKALRRRQNTLNLFRSGCADTRMPSLAIFPPVGKSDLEKFVIAHDDRRQIDAGGLDDIASFVTDTAALKCRTYAP